MKHIPITSFPGRLIETANGPQLYCGGTAYLGLQADSEFQELLIQNIRRYGTSFGASRKSNLRFPIFEAAEALISQWTGCQAAITLSSGYLACQLLSQSLQASGHELFTLPGSHSALTSASAATSPSPDIQELETAIKRSLAASRAPVVLLDSIDFHGKRYPHFDELKSLPLEKLVLVVDDSHGFGVVGENGRGSAVILHKLGAKELIICGSLNKGLALQAGVISGTRDRIDQLASAPLFAGASPTAPAIMATFLDAQEAYQSRHDRLNENVSSFLSLITSARDFEYNEGHAAFSIIDPLLADHLERERIILTRFTYPAQENAQLNRIVLTAAHRDEDIETLANAINTFPQ